jgi:D-arabinose 1-dehydrogenase-like Zn-dependent alcohol dehydrogenase
MKGVYLPGDQTAGIKDWDIPEVGKWDVLVEIKASALCRSDMSIYYGNALMGGGNVIPGHEPAGLVVETGKNVTAVAKGDRIALHCFIGCGQCEYCRRGEPFLCDALELLGFQKHGGDAEYLVAPESTCLKIPNEMSFRTAAISTDAIGNLYNSMKELNLMGSDKLAVVGLGPMGMSGVMVGSALGSEVIAIDLVESRLKKAKELGASVIINAAKENVVEVVRELTKGKGVAKAVECSGSQEGINTALDIVGKHGQIAQIGERSNLTIDPSNQLIRKMVTYFGSWYFQIWQWPEIVDFIMNRIGDSRAQELISHSFSLSEPDVKEAFQLFDEHKTQKVVFEP